MKVGILGGTFSPIHYGHLILAETAYDRFSLDKVLIMPAGDPYFKNLDKIAADSHRENMTRLAIENNPHFEFSDIELKREGNTYTIDTLNELTRLYPDDEFFLIVGSDTLFSIEKWYKPDEIFRMAKLLTSCRNIVKEDLNAQIDHLKAKFGAKIYNLYMPNIDISSTDIRDKVKHGMSIRYYTPDAVIDYIYENKLYLE
ncbi:MAG: nicotinate-nucleotide adenylyltransferase [Lachnospiraceae bacterium]|nr:nicotinate-nucleotide adenylyltransferase [Lachnospiraceae bacterium]